MEDKGRGRSSIPGHPGADFFAGVAFYFAFASGAIRAENKKGLPDEGKSRRKSGLNPEQMTNGESQLHHNETRSV